MTLCPAMFSGALPLRVAVPSPLSTKTMPVGRVPLVSNQYGVGAPVARNVNDCLTPTVNFAELALVITGTVLTWTRMLPALRAPATPM